jgi:hypothetical protein
MRSCWFKKIEQWLMSQEENFAAAAATDVSVAWMMGSLQLNCQE